MPISSNIRTARLVLRPPHISDAEAIFYGYAQDPEVTRYLSWRPHRSIADTVAYLEHYISGASSGTRYPWVIVTVSDNRVIGAIELRVNNHKADMGYVLTRPEWNRGYMTEAVRAIVDAAFHEPSIFRIWAVCDVDNIASARVLEKAGMVREGVLRRYLIHPNISPTPRDVYCYAIVR